MKKRQQLKDLAGERVEILVRLARAEADPALAARHARTAKRIAMHLRLRLPYQVRQLYCKKCKQFIVPGKSARVRVGRSRIRAVRVTCLKCGHVYRRVLPQNKDL